MLKRGISLLLVLLMVLSFGVSCKKETGDDAEEGGTSSVATTSGTEKSKYDVEDSIGTRDYGGKVITIGNVNHDYYMIETDVSDISGNIISDAIYNRNRTVEKRLNVKIATYVPEAAGDLYGLVNDLRNNALSEDKLFDIMFSPMYTTTSALIENLYWDLNGIEEFEFDKAYWSQFANEALEIGGVRHLATGPIALQFYRYAFVTCVNNNLLSTHSDAPDLIKVVKEGKWTLEYQRILAEQYYVDKGEIGVTDEEDILGFYATTHGITVDPYLASCGIKILTKDSDGYVKADPDIERISDAMEAAASLHTSEATYITGAKSNDKYLDKMVENFSNGNVLTVTFRLYEVGRLGDMSDPYTILPVPKLYESQETYHTTLHDSTTAVSIPTMVSADDLSMVGAVIEVLASESYRQVAPAYYETVLKMRYTKAPDNWDIIDMIMSNVVLNYEIPLCYQLSVPMLSSNYTPIANWRYCLNDIYLGREVIASRFNPEYVAQLDAKLENLNAYYRSLNSN